MCKVEWMGDRMKKLPLIILSLLLISLGWYQEIYYYRFTFESLGMNGLTPTIAGVSLSVLLCYFAYKKNYPLFILLLSFSIVCTIFGQLQSYSENQKAYSIETVQEKELLETKQYYIHQIDRINSEIDTKNELLPKDIKELAMWKKNAVDPIRDEIAKLNNQKKEYESLLATTINSLSTGEQVKGIFDNFSDDIGLSSPTLLKYAFWVFYSLFVALLAPSGTRLLSTINPQPKNNKPIEKKEIKQQEDIITKFANSRFRNEEKPASLKGRGEVVKELGISYPAFQKFVSAEKKYNLVRTTGNMTIPNVTRSEYIILLRNKKPYSHCIVAV